MESTPRFQCIVWLWISCMSSRCCALDDPLQPPIISQQPSTTVIYFHENSNETSIQLPCIASGSGRIAYSWTKNGLPYDWQRYRSRITQASHQGSLYIASPRPQDEGYYQCEASNAAGIAVTKVVQLKYAFLEDFAVEDRPFALVVNEFDELSLPCHAAPNGIPKPTIDWVLENMTTGAIRSLNSKRHAIDPDGRLHFSSVLTEDAYPDAFYSCQVSNLAGFRLGSRIMLTVLPPEPVFGKLTIRPLSRHYISPERNLVRIGHPLTLACIYGGTPVPDVTWRKKGGPVRALRASDDLKNGHSLHIPSVTWRDEGVYECNVTNGVGEKKVHSFTVNVVMPPKYLTFRTTNANITLGSTATVSCPVFGIPQPEVEWMVNGTSFQDLPVNPRHFLNYTVLQIANADFSDVGTYQCNASNAFGYDVQNAYLQISDAAFIPRSSAMRTFEMVEGQSQRLDCGLLFPSARTFQWFRDNNLLADERVEIFPNGTLWIHNITQSDEGIYQCWVKSNSSSNALRFDAANLIVMEPTRFNRSPDDQDAPAGGVVTFECDAVVDKKLNMTVEWRRNGVLINHRLPGLIFNANNSLTLTNVTNAHSGVYTCNVHTELDAASASAVLFVKDVPPTPEIIGVKCHGHEAQIDWRALSDFRNPVQQFYLQYSMVDINGTWNDLVNISTPATNYKVELLPGQRYQFRLISVNKVGESSPSIPSRLCEAEPGVPYWNPKGVAGKSGTAQNEMIISWKAMPPIEHNGPSFFYRVYWRPADETDHWNAVDVFNWKQTTVTVDLPTSVGKSFIVKVEARNSIGRASVPAEEIRVIAREEVPLEAPTHLSVLKVLNGSTAVVYWKPISLEAARGDFQGYKLETWTAAEGYGNRRVVEVPGNHTVVILKVLQPSYQNHLRVWAYNRAHDGPRSATLTFSTLFLN